MGDAAGRRGYYREELRPGRFPDWWTWARSDAEAFGFRRTLYWAATRSFLPRFAEPPLRGVARLATRPKPPADGAKDLLTPDLQDALDRRRAETDSRYSRSHSYRRAYRVDPAATWAVEAGDRDASLLGLDIRHPLTSARIVEYSHSLPQRFLVRGRVNKYLHRQAFSGLLPSRVLTLGNKAEFSKFVRTHLSCVSRNLPSNATRDWLIKDALPYLQGALAQPPAGPPMGQGARLWALGGVIGCLALVAGTRNG